MSPPFPLEKRTAETISWSTPFKQTPKMLRSRRFTSSSSAVCTRVRPALSRLRIPYKIKPFLVKGEWITVAATLCLLVAKIHSFDEKGVVLHVLPLLNPDGYDYSRTSPQRRHWRKNLNGLGVDLNRNFGVENVSWGFGNPHNQHSELYQGPRPFSERESQALRR